MSRLKYIISAAVLMLVLSMSAGAEEFIFKYREDVVVPYSLEDDELAFGLYKTDDEAKMKQMLADGLIEFYEPNAEAVLYDDTDDVRFNDYQKDYEYAVTNALGAVNNGTYNGSGVRIAIIDSGIAPNHEDIDYTRIVAKQNYTPDAETNKINPDDVTDVRGHGTSVAGVIAAKTNNQTGLAGLAPDAELVIIKIFDTGTTSLDKIILGVKYAMSQKCDIINMSLGTSVNSPGVKSAIDAAVNSGIIVVAAAGNYTEKDPEPANGEIKYSYPASYPNVISVASVNREKKRSSFSYYNDKVNIAACGEYVSLLNKNGGYSFGNGTSFAAPYITSAAALARQIKPGITGEELLSLLSQTALRAAEPEAGEPSYGNSYGSGIVNIGAMLDKMLGMNISVSDAAFAADGWTSIASITNAGFDSYEIMDVWYMSNDKERYRDRVKTMRLAPRSSVTTDYLGFYTVNHMVWLRDTLTPLGKKSVFETGIM